jgi:hypothetical protein
MFIHVKEFLMIKNPRNKAVVLYILLKLQIFQQSKLFKKIIKMQASAPKDEAPIVTEPTKLRNSTIKTMSFAFGSQGLKSKKINPKSSGASLGESTYEKAQGKTSVFAKLRQSVYQT